MSFRSSLGFPHSSISKESACNAGDLGLILGQERYPGEGNGDSLQYSCLENPMDRGAWQAVLQRFKESDMTEATSHPHTKNRVEFPVIHSRFT